MIIRPATANDVQGIQHVAHVAWHVTYEGIIRPETRANILSEFYSEESLLRSLQRNGAVFFAAVEGQRVIGFAQVLPRPRTTGDYELTRIYVLPDCQRKGVGSQLLAAVEAALPDQHLWVIVERDNKGALEFYRSKGFTKRRELELPVFGENLPFVEMNKAGKRP